MSVNLHDELQALSDVRPTRDLWADALARAGSGERFRAPHRQQRRAWLAVCAGVMICAAIGAAVATISLDGGRGNTKTSGHHGPQGPPGPTVAKPLAGGAQVTMAQATATFGSPLAIPTTPAVQPSDAGPVWALSTPGGTAVAVTFPSKGIWIVYGRPAPPDPASHFKDMATALAGSHLVELNATTPAIYVPGNDGSGANFVDFETNGVGIEVFGNNDESTLEAIAQSILTQLSSSSSP